VAMSGRAGAGRRIALHATVCVRVEDLLGWFPAGQVVFRSEGPPENEQSRAGCRAVSGVPPVASRSPQAAASRKAVPVVSTVSCHLGCRALGLAH
jgi:hypothetical protein